jgi:hypothetical protein
VGRDHVRLHRNNQDGVAMTVKDDIIVAAVTDGCSSGKYCEVGARLGAMWLARWVPHYVRSWSPSSQAEAVRHGLLDFLSRLSRDLAPEGLPIDDLLQHLFLFTFIVAVVTPERTWVFGQGDGVVSVNGNTLVLDPGPDNAPRYVAYALADPSKLRVSPESAAGVTGSLFDGATEDVRSVIIATDGATDLISRADQPLADGSRQGGIDQFEEEPRYIRNPSLMHKRLVVIGEGNGRLRDDTTLALIRRRGGA